jgi:hypothetical protein
LVSNVASLKVGEIATLELRWLKSRSGTYTCPVQAFLYSGGNQSFGPYISQGDLTLYPEGDPNLYPVSDVVKVTSPVTGSNNVPPPIDASQNGNLYSAQFIVRAEKIGTATLKAGLVGNCGNNLWGRVLLVEEDGVTTLTVAP